jgi:hypothetical protein
LEKFNRWKSLSDLVKLTSEQSEQLQSLEALWERYGPALKASAAFSGGMGWKTVKGAEYLVRYQQGEDGKKQFSSFGRRSPETEQKYDEFLNTTGNARAVRKHLREAVALHCRLAKAYGIARLPGRQAEIVDRFWITGVSERLSLIGGTALLAYESGSRTLAPAGLVKDEHLQFFTQSILGLDFDEIEEACDVDKTGCRTRRYEDRVAIRNDDGLVCEILLPAFFLSDLDDPVADLLSAALELPPVRSLTVARDTRPIELTAVDPRTYALMGASRPDDGLWAERAAFAGDLVRQRWPEKFDEDQQAVLDDEASGHFGRMPCP